MEFPLVSLERLPDAMPHILPRLALTLIAGSLLLAPGALDGRDWDAASQLYGEGVHAYFAGRSSDAESYLSQAIEISSHDPRPYYFRGLARLRMGRTGDARTDFQDGAALEAAAPGRYAVGAALQRVQGPNRLTLEQFRREGRDRAAIAAAEQARMRGEHTVGRDPSVFRERVVVPLDELLRPGGPQPLAAEELAPRVEPAAPVEPPLQPVAPPPAVFDDADDDPFADAPPRPVAPPPAAADVDAEDPFRDDEPQPELEMTAPAAPPQARPAEIDEDDPFADY